MTDLGMFGWATQDQIDNPYTQPGTYTAPVEPTNPWWLGPNPNTGQQPWEYNGSPGQAAWQTAQQAIKAPSTKTFDPGTIKNLLRQFQLEELLPLLNQWEVDDLSPDQITALLYDRASDAGKIVDRLYPDLRLLQEAGRPPQTITQIQAGRLQTRQLIEAEGFSDVLGDPNAIYRDYAVAGKSLLELGARLKAIGDFAEYETANNPATKSILDAAEAYYGVRPTRKDLVAFAFDENLPALERKLKAASIGGAAATSGFGGISREEAEGLAAQGITQEDATAGFGTLSGLGEIVNPLPGQQGDVIDRETQLGAVFGGNANAARRIARKQREAVGGFGGGGGFAAGQEGFGGIGTAR